MVWLDVSEASDTRSCGRDGYTAPHVLVQVQVVVLGYPLGVVLVRLLDFSALRQGLQLPDSLQLVPEWLEEEEVEGLW